MCKSINTIVLLITSFLFSNLFAQTNPLDSAFAQNGVHVVNINTTTLGAIKVAAQSDGKLVMCSSKQYGTDSYDFCVMRFNTDGSIDSTFGLNGTVVKDLQSASDFTCDVNVQKDDKIIVVGSTGSFENRDFAMVRFNSDGSLDQAFGINGVVKLDILYDDVLYTVHTQSDGKILAGGMGTSTAQLYRFLENGTLDPSFGTNGRVSLSLGESTIIFDITTGSNDEIFLAGQIGGSSAGGFISKLNDDGSLNSSFAINGNYVINSSDQEYINTIAVQNDGKLVAAGAYGTMIGSDPFAEYLVIRLLPDGSPDSSFNNTGILRFNIDSNNENQCHSILCMSSGEMLASGYSGNIFTGECNVSLAKIKSDGSFDSTFAMNGKLVVSFGNSLERAQGALLNSDEKLVVSGFSGNNVNPLLCRFLTNANDPALEQSLIIQGNSWNVLAVGYIPGDPYLDTIFHTITHKISVDTIINSVLYNKILSSTEENPLSWQSAGFIREANNKVWMREDADGEDYLLYDFGAMPGEVVQVGLVEPVSLTVDSITPVQINGIDRLKFWLSFNDYHETWITGIGSNKGICYSGSATITGGWYWLLCMTDTLGPVYNNPGYESCYLVTVNEQYVFSDFSIFPNPVNDYFSLSLPEGLNNTDAELTILDVSGHVVYQTQIAADQQHYSIANLKVGVYLCRISSGRYFGIKKLIIIK